VQPPNLKSNGAPPLYVLGIPGWLGGASTKITHLLRLLRNDFRLTVVAPEVWVTKDKPIREILGHLGLTPILLRDLPRKLEGVGLAVCDEAFFTSGRAE
jgi:hypothetical protein